MTHALRSPMRHAQRLHPDAKRIAGMAAAITLNLALLMLLLVPMQAAPPLSLQDTGPQLSWVLPKAKAPPPPPVHVPVTHHHAAPVRPVPAPRPTTEVPQQVVVDQARSDMLIAGEEGTGGPRSSNGVGEPLPGVTLEYADAPAPAYPRDALRDGVEGVVMLQVLVDVDGRPLSVDVQRSSGDRRLDNAARKQVLEHWRFRAAMKDGRAVQAVGLVPIAFNLQ